MIIAFVLTFQPPVSGPIFTDARRADRASVNSLVILLRKCCLAKVLHSQGAPQVLSCLVECSMYSYELQPIRLAKEK